MTFGAFIFITLLFAACYDTGKTIKRNSHKRKETK